MSSNDDTKAVTALCVILKRRSVKVLGLQLLIGMMLVGRATSRRAITVLNHAGISVSYTTAWKYLRELVSQSHYQDLVRSGRWQWVFDNVNLHQTVRHERQDHHSTMLNITSRLAIRLRYFPEWEFDWSDDNPQRSRQSLRLEDFLPTEEDATELTTRAIQYTMHFLVNEFSSLKYLRNLLPKYQSLHPVVKTEVIPQTVLFKDEKYIQETIDILSQLIDDGNLNGDPQMVIGDQMTCKNIRGGKLWRQSEIQPINKLSWVKEVPGDFHFLWECLRVIFLMFWGSPAQEGSLCNMREIIRRVQVDKGVKVFNVGDEFRIHVFKAHFKASMLPILNIQTPSDNITHQSTQQWLQDTAERIVSDVLTPSTSNDPVHDFHRSFLHHMFLYVDLREAIRWENGPQIIRHWKWWLPRFLATGCKNYAAESVNLTANLIADFPKHMSYIATHNRTVNTSGIAGRGKPIDQLIEHYNLVFKQTLRAGGGNLTTRHVEDVSLCALFLMEASKKADKVFNVPPATTAHTIRDSDRDIEKMVTHLQEARVSTVDKNRTSPQFTDPVQSGWQKLALSDWLKNTLARHLVDDSTDLQHREGELDLDYELADVI